MTGSNPQRGKPYIEAFPTLSLNAMRRAWAKGQRVIEWRNEQGVVVGHVEMVSMDDAAVTFSHQFFGTPNVEKTGGRNTLVVSERRVNPQRVAREFTCPAGQCHVDRLYFVRGKWCCRRCHDIVHLIQRLSPLHKAIVERDALSNNLATTAFEQRRTRDYHNAVRKHERLGRITAQAPTLPPELSFRCLHRWLEAGEVPGNPVAGDENAYGWVPGERRGLKAFVTPDPILPVQDSLLRRLPPSPALIGLRLFKGDLERLVAEHFVEEGHAAAVQAMREGLLSREELAAVIARAAMIQRLELDTVNLTVTSGVDEEGEPWAHTTLPYSGATMLLRGKVPGSTVPSKLRANYNQNTITFGIVVQQAEWRRAEQVIRSGVRLVEDQLQAQADLLARYEVNMAHNTGAFAAMLLEGRKGRNGAGRLTVNVEH